MIVEIVATSKGDMLIQTMLDGGKLIDEGKGGNSCRDCSASSAIEGKLDVYGLKQKNHE